MTQSIDELSRTNLISPEMAASPFGFYAELLEKSPVLWSERHRAWLVGRYDDVSAAFRHEQMGADRIAPYLREQLDEAGRARFGRMFEILSKWLVFLDPPDHSRLRKLVHKAFTPRAVKALQGRIEETAAREAEAIRARLEAGDVVDLVADFCEIIPPAIFSEMFGFSPEDGDRLKTWTEDLGMFINGAPAEPGRDERVQAAVEGLEKYFRASVEKYRAHPVDNILSALVQANEDGDVLSDIELIATCITLIDAGYKTVQNAMCNAIYLLLESEDGWERLASEPQLMTSAVEECLRMLGPAKTTVRRAKGDIEFRGANIKDGSRVYLILAAANRDPRQFERPNEFVIDRTDNQHLAFAQGIHFCLGSALARLELTSSLAELVNRVPRPELAIPAEGLPWHRVLLLSGLQELPVRRAGVRT
ncbi:cytochrome P450 [Qaidamihabitans albus]|uniref:cytochrome P450 n=1 Tax=Qaidamihabitans albus TaxID=2795733 RepID=UPI0018F1DD30|nr:cytochrome P450 [Qaidamihabitans albus]